MIEKRLRDQIAQLIERADRLEDVVHQNRNNHWMANVEAWNTSVLNVIRLALPDPLQPYRQAIESPLCYFKHLRSAC